MLSPAGPWVDGLTNSESNKSAASPMKTVQFPSLNGLRFLAASGVVYSHLQQIKDIQGFRSAWQDPAVQILGGLCVTFFFVLSGFLITYLLMEEVIHFRSISVRKFYFRRVLRIWPVYFIIVMLAFAILPAIPFFENGSFRPSQNGAYWDQLALFLLFSPHVEQALFLPVTYAGVMWSIGVEEWFYAIWPWIIKYGRGREVLFLASVIVALVAARALFPVNSKPWLFLYTLRFDCMAVGGLYAVLLLRARHSVILKGLLNILYRTDVQLVLYLVTAFAMIQYWWFSWSAVTHLCYSLIYGAVILNLATNPRSILSLENRALHWLGDISYGLYCYHWTTVTAAALIVKRLLPSHTTFAASYLVNVLAIALSLLVAGLSYEFIERRFLALKQKPTFTRVPNLAHESLRSA
jgi:peptidoglycan/LPS O-acetylase OafA/YrhL